MQNKSVQTTPPEPAKAAAAAQHNLILENRHLATATGIKRIVSYDDTAASLETQQGGLTIGGRGTENLRPDRLCAIHRAAGKSRTPAAQALALNGCFAASRAGALRYARLHGAGTHFGSCAYVRPVSAWKITYFAIFSGSLYICSGRGDIAGICCGAKPFGHSARVYGGIYAGGGGGWPYGHRTLYRGGAVLAVLADQQTVCAVEDRRRCCCWGIAETN